MECAEKKSKEATAREMGVDSKRIHEWCKQKQMLASLKKKGASSRKRQCGAGRKALDVNFEDALFSWILEPRSRNIRVSRKMIRQEARSLSSAKDFHASTCARRDNGKSMIFYWNECKVSDKNYHII